MSLGDTAFSLWDAGFDACGYPKSIEKETAMTKWQTMDTAPKDGTVIWGWLNDMGWQKLVWLNSVVRAEYNGWTVDEETEPCWAMAENKSDDDWEPDYWMPESAIPTPPKKVLTP